MPCVAGLVLLLVGLASGSAADVKLNEELAIPAFAGPDRHLMVRPVDSPSDQIRLSVGVSLLDADVNVPDQRRWTFTKVTLGGWLTLEWTDHRLSWSGGNVTSTRVLPSRIWTPDLTVYNQVPVTTQWVHPTPSIVYSSGAVLYIPLVSFTVRCRRNGTDSLHYRIVCPFKIGSWTHSVEEMDLVTKNSTIDTSDFISNNYWAVESTSLVRQEKMYECCPDAYVTIEGEVVLKW